ncbi:MAG: DNA polymerase III subunit gamma and tau, partial [Phycicoccus sp.]
TVDALAAADAAAVFRAIDRVVETGLDPRRFVEDLLERLRDLIIVQAVGDGAATVLRHHPEDQLARMGHQAAAFGAGALSRAADVANAGLTEMTGATAPRLQLELLIARVLLPGAAGEQGYAVRLDRLERRLDVGGVPSEAGGAPPPARPQPRSRPVPDAAAAPSSGDAVPPEPGGDVVSEPGADAVPPEPGQDVVPEPGADAVPEPGGGAAPAAPAASAPAAADTSRDQEPPAGSGRHDVLSGRDGPEPAGREPVGSGGAAASSARRQGGLHTDAVRRSWPDVLVRLGELRRTTWTLVSQNAQVADYDGERVVLTVATAGLAEAFRRGPHADYVRQALVDVLGLDARVEAQPGDVPPPAVAPTAPDAAAPGSSTSPTGPEPSTGPTSSASPASSTGTTSSTGQPPSTGTASSTGQPSSTGTASSTGQPPSTGTASSTGQPPSTGTASSTASAPGAVASGRPTSSARSGSTDHGSTTGPSAVAGGPPGPAARPDSGPGWSSPLERARAQVAAEPAVAPPVIDDSAISPDDEAVDGAGDVGVPVIERMLGGTVVAEEPR